MNKHYVIIGRLWKDKNGNTYHSVEVYVNSKFIARKDYEYGYENCYMQTAFSLLQDHGFIPKEAQYFDMHKYIDREHVVYSKSYVATKKDL